jgi:AraC-like DNA-binding protein
MASSFISRRVEQAKQLLQAGADLSLAEVALRAGFSDQSQFGYHFKRLVGVTPVVFCWLSVAGREKEGLGKHRGPEPQRQHQRRQAEYDQSHSQERANV